MKINKLHLILGFAVMTYLFAYAIAITIVIICLTSLIFTPPTTPTVVLPSELAPEHVEPTPESASQPEETHPSPEEQVATYKKQLKLKEFNQMFGTKFRTWNQVQQFLA